MGDLFIRIHRLRLVRFCRDNGCPGAITALTKEHRSEFWGRAHIVGHALGVVFVAASIVAIYFFGRDDWRIELGGAVVCVAFCLLFILGSYFRQDL